MPAEQTLEGLRQMTDGTLAAVVLAIGLVEALASQTIFAFDTYWAFRLRSAMSVGIYRRQAAAVGAVSLAWILVFVDYVFVAGILNLYALFYLVDVLIALFLFYWIDSAVLATRRSDPLARDTLHWRKLRLVLWGAMVAAAVGVVGLAAYYELVTGSEPQLLSHVILNYGVSSIPIGIAVASGVATLPLAARRTKDEFLRRSLWWFAAFLVVLIFVDPVNSEIWTFTDLIAGGYCLYKSARSLVPHSIAKYSETVP
jgi:hypothetical protein